MNNQFKIGIINVSDRASVGEYAPEPGQRVEAYLKACLTSPWEAEFSVIPDEQDQIEQELKRLADDVGCSIIFTTGGTGPAPRDVTPEATSAVCNKMLPGFGEAMRMESLRIVPTAILSRQTSGIRGESLIVNLPGKPKAIGECLDVIFPAIPYCIFLICGKKIETNPDKVKAFTPKS